MLFWWTDSIEVTCQQLRLRTFSLNMENSSTGGKKPDSSCHFCRLCQYTHDGLFSWQDIRYLHICWIPCRRLHAARHCAHCHAASKAVCNVTVHDKSTFVIGGMVTFQQEWIRHVTLTALLYCTCIHTFRQYDNLLEHRLSKCITGWYWFGKLMMK